MNNTKHYTHPALGINVYKDNMGYFAKLEKEEQMKNKASKISSWLDNLFLVLVGLNPLSWIFIAITYQMYGDLGVITLMKEFGLVLYPVVGYFVFYIVAKVYFKIKYKI